MEQRRKTIQNMIYIIDARGKTWYNLAPTSLKSKVVMMTHAYRCPLTSSASSLAKRSIT